MIKIRNKYVIDTPIITILKTIRSETALQGDMFLRDIKQSGASSVLVTCPFHKNHNEKKPACSVFIHDHESGWKEGQFHCFACGATGELADLVSACFYSSDITFGEDWLVERFGTTLVSSVEYLPEITLERKIEEKTFLDESILQQYAYYHPYMWYRKLSQPVVDTFKVGYDSSRDAITFPVYDEKHMLVMVTARSVKTKMFWIPEGGDKPVYLLYYLLENNIKTAYVCESQINALYMWSLGYPAVALFGTGSERQFNILRKSGIRNFILMYDGDEPGRKGAYRFRKNMPKDCFITDIILPAGKDVNDLSAEEVKQLLSYS